jgi:hypothetical protein
MRRSFLAILRSDEGRSLGRAIVALFILSAMLTGFHGVAFASPHGPEVLCLSGGPDHGQMPGSIAHEASCCLAGCGAPNVADVPAGQASLAMPVEPGNRPDIANATIPRVAVRTTPLPRGPPVLI